MEFTFEDEPTEPAQAVPSALTHATAAAHVAPAPPPPASSAEMLMPSGFDRAAYASLMSRIPAGAAVTEALPTAPTQRSFELAEKSSGPNRMPIVLGSAAVAAVALGAVVVFTREDDPAPDPTTTTEAATTSSTLPVTDQPVIVRIGVSAQNTLVITWSAAYPDATVASIIVDGDLIDAPVKLDPNPSADGGQFESTLASIGIDEQSHAVDTSTHSYCVTLKTLLEAGFIASEESCHTQ